MTDQTTAHCECGAPIPAAKEADCYDRESGGYCCFDCQADNAALNSNGEPLHLPFLILAAGRLKQPGFRKEQP